VKRKGPKKVRPLSSRRKKRPEAAGDWGRLVFVVSLVFLGVAVLLLLIVALRQVSKARAAGPVGNEALSALSSREQLSWP
jgi:hypothetical protein